MAKIVAPLLQVPIGFEFRVVPGNWSLARAKVVGWYRRIDGSIDTESLLAATLPPVPRTFRMELTDLPEELWRFCVNGSADVDPGRFCENYEFPALVRARQSEFPGIVADPWKMRWEFLKTKGEPEQLVAFLNKWGQWNIYDVERLEDICGYYNSFRASLVPGNSRSSVAAPSFPGITCVTETYPYFWIKTNLCAQALHATRMFDFVRGVKFRTCQRLDCATPFAVQSEHRRNYCCQYCGHLESVRRNRQRRKVHLKRT
jgi:hypothetical protein